MSKPASSFATTPLTLNYDDIKRICVVHWDSEPLAEGQKSSYVFVKPLREYVRFPNGQGVLKIEGEWYRRLSRDSAEVFRLGDQINVVFSKKGGGIRWIERRDNRPESAMINQLFS